MRFTISGYISTTGLRPAPAQRTCPSSAASCEESSAIALRIVEIGPEDAYGTISEPDSCFGKKKPTFPFVHNITDPVESICIYVKFIEDFDCHVG